MKKFKSPVIEAHDLRVSYNKRSALYGIDFAISKGNLVGVVGPNGAGKSTLIKAMIGQVTIAGGWVNIFNQSAHLNLHHMGYIPQKDSIDWDFPITVEDVVLMGSYARLGAFRPINKQEKRRANAILDRLGMLGYADTRISELSGGQQQRSFLARALLQDTPIYLMDEPFTGIDITTEKLMIKILQEMRDEGKTILVVHHDLSTVREYFDKVLLINRRQIAFGLTKDVLTKEKVAETYGGRLEILENILQQR